MHDVRPMRTPRPAALLVVVVVALAACATRSQPLGLPAGHPASAESGAGVAPGHPVVRAVDPPSEPQVPDAEEGFVCPMHPDVTSTTPGACPKCGMALVPKKPRGETQSDREHPR